uniref:Potassium channel tetramerisation-type BTB domain-containing protein n=1 Tax=Pseudonaja textilis TaxID=8673 RepID=A0A670XP24_PSETE
MALHATCATRAIEMKPLEEKIFLNIGGLRYETYASTLQAFPGTKLCRLTEPQAAATFDYDPDTQEFFFDRSSCLFEDVLNYYRTKQLHCPDLTCKSALDEDRSPFQNRAESLVPLQGESTPRAAGGGSHLVSLLLWPRRPAGEAQG